ncbi:MAG: hypothetical protein IPK82_23590 [Polyangiaceae bacterium]|nr:hypothetical protein [Polyangiaceae bacterium]MBK8255634.1 hypothetical protein [Polyangiaceae bacterium]
MTTRYQPNQPYADDFNCELCGRTAAAKCDECNLWHCEPCLVRKNAEVLCAHCYAEEHPEEQDDDED